MLQWYNVTPQVTAVIKLIADLVIPFLSKEN